MDLIKAFESISPKKLIKTTIFRY